MRITDELREWARGFENVWVKPASKEIVVTTGTSMPVDHVNMRLFIEGMLDRVDAEHERQCAESWMRGHDAWAAIDRGDEMAEHGWIRLPKDADGEYIHIGDVMEWPYGNGEFIVEGIGGNTLFYIDKDSNECEWTAAGDKRHHHEPTVDGILRDFGVDIAHALDADPNATVPEAVIAEYAAKLRLAGEDE